MAATQAPKCARCAGTYSATAVGTLSCFGHPGTYDVAKHHYDCCGASIDPSLCFAHIETQKNPDGCHRVDHVLTTDEYHTIMNQRPYVVAPLSQAMEMMPQVQKTSDTVHHFQRPEDMKSGTISIKVPRTMSVEGVVDGQLAVDVAKEHKALRDALIEDDVSVTNASGVSDTYTEEWERHITGAKDVITPDFVPFALILRVGLAPLPHRRVNHTLECRV